MLNAIDLNRGEFAWRVPLGEYPELTARGIPQTGSENFGGTIVTAGGLVFIGATKEHVPGLGHLSHRVDLLPTMCDGHQIGIRRNVVVPKIMIARE